jgi:hypothetical protein
MTADEPPRFSAEEVIQIASKLAVDDATFMIGGQATNLWVWFYAPREPKLQTSSPLTSRDIDYFGTPAVAKVFADAIGGKLVLPTMDHMNTPSSARVHASINGKDLVIDFLNGVLGVKNNELRRGGASTIEVEADADGKAVRVEIKVLHPVLCLKSRVANMLSPIMKRRDSFAWAQLHAAVIVVQRHIDEALTKRDWDEAHECLSALFRYLRSDEYGKKADKELNVDILNIIRAFQNDERINRRYRGFQLKSNIAHIEKRRAGRRG